MTLSGPLASYVPAYKLQQIRLDIRLDQIRGGNGHRERQKQAEGMIAIHKNVLIWFLSPSLLLRLFLTAFPSLDPCIWNEQQFSSHCLLPSRVTAKAQALFLGFSSIPIIVRWRKDAADEILKIGKNYNKLYNQTDPRTVHFLRLE